MKLIFDYKGKGWLKALGLHHLVAPVVSILLVWYLSPAVAQFLSAFWVGWYARHEYGWGPQPPKQFEIMDFVTPALVCGSFYIGAF